MAGYTRNDTSNNIADGNVINASDLDGEFDSIQTAFNETSGHTHDGTVGEGAPISVVGPAQDINVTITEVVPKTTNTMSLGTAALQFKDMYIDGTANIDSLVADTADINAGTIDNAVIGGATPEAATFTTLTATDAVSLDDAVTINDSAADVDFRVEGVGKPNALFVQGSDGNVGVNTNSPTTTLDVNGTVKATVLNVAGSSSLDGAVVVNETGADVDFRVESDTNANALFVQGSNGAVGIGTSSPLSQLEVSDTDGATGINVTAYRNLTTYGNSYVQFNGPRFDTADQDAVIGRGAITLLGNAADTSSSMWISAATASLAPATATEANMQGYNAGLNITSDGELGFWDSGTERFTITSAGNVGINTSSPASTLDVSGTVTATGLDLNGNADLGGNITLSQASGTTVKRSDNTGSLSIQAGDDALSAALVMYGNAHATLPNWTVLEGNTMLFRPVDNSPEYMRFVEDTGVVFNEGSADVDFRIESDTNTHAFFLQGSDGYVGIGTSSPQARLDITGATGNQLVVATNTNAADTEAGILFKHATAVNNFDGGGIRSIRNGTTNDFGLAFDIGEDAASAIGMFISGGENTRGYVGIRTGDSPQTQLHVDAGTKNYTGTTPGLTSYAVSIESGSAGTTGVGIGSHNDTPSIQGFGGGTSYNLALCPANGYVGIGTSSPSAKLEIDAGSATGTQLQITTTGFGHNFDMVDGRSTARIRNTDGNLRLYADQGNEQASSGIHFLVDNLEMMRINSDGYVGIGTSSPSEKLHISQDSAFAIQMERTGGTPSVCEIANSGNLLNISNNVNGIALLTGATPTEAMRVNAGGNVGIGTASLPRKFQVSGTTSELMRLERTSSTAGVGIEFKNDNGDFAMFGTASGDGTGAFVPQGDGDVDLGNSSNRFNDFYLSGGVYLGGTGAANLLEDYEEGTWTPVPQDSSGNSGTAATASGYYTKVGNLVYLNFFLENIDTTGLTAGNDFRITGLPFSSKSLVGGQFYLGNLRMTNVAFEGHISLGILDATNYIRVIETLTSAGSDFTVVSDLISGSANLYGTIMYMG